MSLLDLKFIDLHGPSITFEHFREFESFYGIFVPDELKELFIRTNHCILEYPIIECNGIDGGVMPEGWKGISAQGMNYKLDFFGASLGDKVLPFCSDPGGNIFTLQIDGTRQVGVYYVNLDEPFVEFGSRRYKSYWLAENLEDFVSRIVFSSS